MHCRPELKPILKTKIPKLSINRINTGAPCLFINGRVLFDQKLFNEIASLNKNQSHLLVYKGNIVAAYLRDKNLDYFKDTLENVPNSQDLINHLRTNCVAKELKTINMINNLWDLLSLNPQTIVSDFENKKQPGIIKGEIKPFTAIYNENNVFIEKGTVVEDFVTINAEHGPVYIEKNAYIESGSRLEGPLFIGQNTRILGGRISSCSIGTNCKVSGEMSNSIMLNYSNKAHTGFIGHSYIGEWVNLGAGTTTSNLKNTYGSVSIDNGTDTIKTNQTFFGSIIGDHTKTGINTTLNTGTIISYGCNIFGLGLHDKFIPAFSWGSPQKYTNYDLAKFFEIEQKMMARRSKKLELFEKEIITETNKIIKS